jgi:myo-inositol-1(or 4)-monophosphatase
MLETLEEAARAGGRILVDVFPATSTAALRRHTLRVRAKGPSDFVSEADLGSEAAIRAVLLSAYPDAAWRGEETGFHEGTSSSLEFVVDPLDGTTNFLCGIPHFCIAIAARESNKTICAVVYQPLTGEMFSAVAGSGATCNGEPLQMSTREHWEQVVLATGIPHHGSSYHHSFAAELGEIRDRVGGVRRFGSAALDLAWVACGRFDGFWERGLRPWDVAAGNLLVREAGGVVTGLDPEHDPDTGISVLAATPWLHAEWHRVFQNAGGVAT